MTNCNGSGFKGEGYVEGLSVRLSEGPSEQAVLDLEENYPCRYCSFSALHSTRAQAEYEHTNDESVFCYGRTSNRRYVRAVYGLCQEAQRDYNKPSKTLVLSDRYGTTIVRSV